MGLTQSELAQKAGIPFRTLQGIEWDQGDPRFGNVQKLAIALGLTAQDLWAAPRASSPLSQGFATKPTAEDVASLVAEFLAVSPQRREMAMAILFADDSLTPENLDLSELFQKLLKLG